MLLLTHIKSYYIYTFLILISAVGPARQFNGNNQEVLISHPNFTRTCYGNLDLCPNGLTVIFWLRVPDDAERTILSSQGKVESDKTLHIQQLKGKKLQATFFTGDQVWTVVDNKENLRINSWNHVAVIYNPNAEPKMYINGISCDCDAAEQRFKADREVGVYRVARQAGETGEFSAFSMQELRFYDQALLQDAVQLMYNGGEMV